MCLRVFVHVPALTEMCLRNVSSSAGGKVIAPVRTQCMKDLEVKHGALEEKPIFQPNHTSEHLRKPPLNQGQQIKMQHV